MTDLRHTPLLSDIARCMPATAKRGDDADLSCEAMPKLTSCLCGVLREKAMESRWVRSGWVGVRWSGLNKEMPKERVGEEKPGGRFVGARSGD